MKSRTVIAKIKTLLKEHKSVTIETPQRRVVVLSPTQLDRDGDFVGVRQSDHGAMTWIVAAHVVLLRGGQ